MADLVAALGIASARIYAALATVQRLGTSVSITCSV